MKKLITSFLKEESGQDLVEYALLLSVLAIAGIVGLSTLATTVSGVWTTANTKAS
jgi:pilus assembly protein Flp/PilA